MKQAFVFGGLSVCGQPLSEVLVKEGITVYSLSSALSPEEAAGDEERRYILGRNSLFHTVDEPGSLSCDTIFIADAFRVGADANRMLRDKINRLMNAGVWVASQKVIILSGLQAAAYEKSVAERNAKQVSLSAEGKAAGEMENYLIKASSAAGQENIIILRADLSAMSRRGSRETRILGELYSAGCRGLNRFYYDEDEGPESEGNKALRLVLGNRFPGKG